MADAPEVLPVDLVGRVTDLLGGCLGANPISSNRSTPGSKAARFWQQHIAASPLRCGAFVLLTYAILFVALPLALIDGPDWHLLWLSMYGSLYAAWATTIARATSARVLETIADNIVPNLRRETAASIADEIAARFTQRRLFWVSWSVGILGMLAAYWAITQDVKGAPFQIAWWSIGWLFLFVTAARTTDVARFYYVFSKNLAMGKDTPYIFDPPRSLLVKDISALGQNILLFWSGIAVSIACLIPFIAMADYGLQHIDLRAFMPTHSNFAWIVIPITSIFSIPFGTIVFLRSESACRRFVKQAVRRTLRSAEMESAGLFERREELAETDWRRLRELVTLHSTLTRSGFYRSFFISGLSLLIPFIGPVVPLFKFLAPQLWAYFHNGQSVIGL